MFLDVPFVCIDVCEGEKKGALNDGKLKSWLRAVCSLLFVDMFFDGKSFQCQISQGDKLFSTKLQQSPFRELT